MISATTSSTLINPLLSTVILAFSPICLLKTTHYVAAGSEKRSRLMVL